MLDVAPIGINASGNREFAVIISPDPDRLTLDANGDGVLDSSGMAVELAFAVDGSTIVSVNETVDWRDDNDGTLSNPGQNPFTGTLTEGIVIEGNMIQVFGSLGSTGDVSDLTLGAIMENNLMMVIETLGSGDTTVRWGEAASGQLLGAAVYQDREAFVGAAAGISGSVTAPEPATAGLLLIAASAAAVGRARRRSMA